MSWAMIRRPRSSESPPRAGSAGEAKTQPPPSAGSRVAARTSIPPSLSARVVENGIIGAAMKVFARRGFAATRVEDVLDEAGIARRTFYRYFTSKEDVLAAAYELATSELLRAFDHAADAMRDARAALGAGIDLYLDFHVRNATLLRVLVEHSVRSDSPLAEHRRRVRAHLLDALSLAADGRKVPLDRFTAIALVSALEGVALSLIEEAPASGGVDAAKRAVHDLVRMALD